MELEKVRLNCMHHIKISTGGEVLSLGSALLKPLSHSFPLQPFKPTDLTDKVIRRAARLLGKHLF